MVTLLPPISAMTYMFPTDRHTAAIDQHDNQVVQMGHSGPATQQAAQIPPQRRHQHPKYISDHRSAAGYIIMHPTTASNRCIAVGTESKPLQRPKGPSADPYQRPI